MLIGVSETEIINSYRPIVQPRVQSSETCTAPTKLPALNHDASVVGSVALAVVVPM